MKKLQISQKFRGQFSTAYDKTKRPRIAKTIPNKKRTTRGTDIHPLRYYRDNS